MSPLKMRYEVRAIDGATLERVLKRIGLYDDVMNGEAKCYICDKIVKFDNLGGLLGVGGEIVIICDNPSCIYRASEISLSQIRKQYKGRA